MKPPERGVGSDGGRCLTHEPSLPTACSSRKPRDIFPLPLLADSKDARPLGCRKVLRKFLVDQHLKKEVNHTLKALNSMYGCPDSGSTMISLEEELFGHGAAQLKAVDNVVQSVHAIGKPPCGLTCSGAFESLRAAEGYAEEPAVGSLCSFDLDKVSLPDGGWDPIPLSRLWGPDGCETVKDFVTSQLLPPHEVEKRLRATGVQQPYSDPLLTVRSNYIHFLKRLHMSNLVEFSNEEPLENIAIFFVTKKNDRQRMIVDARRANCHFRDPAYVNLCTGDTINRLEYGVGDTLTIGMADLKDAFYHLEMPYALRRFFCLPRVRCEDLDWLGGGSHRPCKGKWAYPRLTVVPMGWSWALWWCQKLHERIVLRAGLNDDNQLRDRHPFTNGACSHIQYVDNLVVLGSDAAQVQDGFKKAVGALRDAGLQVHEVELGTDGAQVLGWDISQDAVMRPTRKRFWKIRMSIRGLLQRGRASSKQIEKLLGHCCFISLARRESLSIFGQAYNFVRRFAHTGDEHPLWPSVRKEFDTWDGILPLIFRNLKSEWSDKVYAVDASEWGLGCTISQMPLADVQRYGRFCERWKFKDPDATRARSTVTSEVTHEGLVHVDEADHIDEEHETPGPCTTDFPSVPFEAMADREWSVVGRHRWRQAASMPVNEARATLYAVKHMLRCCANHSLRHVVFSDSMTATCAISRGRAKSFGLRRVCQQIGSLLLVTGSQLVVRWIASEFNAADSPSRGGWLPSVPT